MKLLPVLFLSGCLFASSKEEVELVVRNDYSQRMRVTLSMNDISQNFIFEKKEVRKIKLLPGTDLRKIHVTFEPVKE